MREGHQQFDCVNNYSFRPIRKLFKSETCATKASTMQSSSMASSRHRNSSIKTQSSKHGFYKEFSLINTNANHSLKKKSLSRIDTFKKKVKPLSDETYCSKSYLSRFCNGQCLFTLFPLFQWLPHYQCGWLKRDLMAGVTVAILLVPQSLAYATLAGLPPEWGLYASVMPIFFYVFWSTSCSVAVGPVAPTAIMVASAVEGVMSNLGYTSSSEGYDELYQSIAMTLSFVVGIILIVFGMIRAGFIIVFLSRPVMIGFIMSAAFIILINQFRSLLGLDMDRYPLFYQSLIAVIQSLNTIHWYTAMISVISLFILFLPKCCLRGKIPKWVPIPLIVIVLWILISYLMDLESLGVAIVGADIQSGFPAPKPPNFDYIGDVFAAAVVVAIVSYMGSIALAKGFDQKTQETYKQQLSAYNAWHKDQVEIAELPVQLPVKLPANARESKEVIIKSKEFIIKSDDKDEHIPKETDTFSMQSESAASSDDEDDVSIDKPPIKPLDLPPIKLSPNVEFIAFGIANLLGSFFSSQAVSASFSRSALNFDMNGHTQISSVIQATICLLCLLFLMPLLSPLPKCVLASLVTVSVYRLIKNGVHEFIFLTRVSRIELIEFCVAFFAPLVIGLEIGIFLSIGTSIIVNLLRHSFASIIYLGRLESKMSDDAEYVDCALFKQAKSIPHVTIIEMKAELAFSNNNQLVDKIRHLLAGGNKYIVVSLNLTSFIDTTAIRQIVTIFEDAKGAFICLSQCRPKVIELINRFEEDTDEFPDNIKTFVSTHDAVLYLRSMRSKMLHKSEAFGSDIDSDEPLSSLDYNFDTYTGDTGVTPIARSKIQSATVSELDILHHDAKKSRFSFRSGGRMEHKSHSTHDAIESASEEEEAEEEDVEQPNFPYKEPRVSAGSAGSAGSSGMITSLSFDHKESSPEEQVIELRIVNSMEIAKIDEGKELDEFHGSVPMNGATEIHTGDSGDNTPNL
eukprot:443512_1